MYSLIKTHRMLKFTVFMIGLVEKVIKCDSSLRMFNLATIKSIKFLFS